MIQALATTDPIQDPAFARESDGARSQVIHRLPVMQAIDASAKKNVAIEQQARSLARPYTTVRGLYHKWVKSGRNWRVLINRAKFPAPDEINLSSGFLAFWQSLYLTYQRDTTGRRAHGALVARYWAWVKSPLDYSLAIPGYDAPPKVNVRTGIPEGWTYSNLMRHLPSKLDRVLTRQGGKAASNFLPSVITSRTQLTFGQVMYFDDSQHDEDINLAGINSRTMRPVSFNAMEALSSSAFELGLKPQIWTPDGVRTLDQLDFFWFVMLVLTRHGYNAKDGTRLIFEWGTTNIDKDANFDQLITRATGGAVTVDRSGKFGRPEIRGMLFEGQSSGNFKFKAPMESLFNLVRNYSSMLPAPTGLSPEKAPEESYGRKKYNDQLSRLIDKISPDLFLRLRRPVLEWEDYTRVSRLIHDLIDMRRDHDLEGWHKLGFTGQRYRLDASSDMWISEAEYQLIPAQQRAALDHIVRQPGHFESFKLSPREVFRGMAGGLKKLPMHMIPALAPERAWRDAKLSQSMEFEIQDSYLDSEPLIYLGRVRNVDGHEVMLQRGQTYRVLINIFDPSTMWVAEAGRSRDKALIGTTARVVPACKLDHESILAQLGDVAHMRANQTLDVHQRMATEAERRVAMYHANKQIQEAGTSTPEGRTRLKQRAQAEKRLEEQMGAEDPTEANYD